MLDWNDLRYFLAIARSGSTLAGGRTLQVSQTTAARRIAALETALGVTLFERRQSGYLLTPVGEALLDHARGVEAAAAALTDAAAAQVREVGGTVRLTIDEVFAVTVLNPILRDLHDAHPNIRMEIDTSCELRDLAAGTADVALRSSVSMTGEGLVGRRVANGAWAVYCSCGYADAHGQPRSVEELREHPLIGGGGDGVWRYYRTWLRQHELETAVTMQHGSASGLLAAVRAGVGVAMLPCFIADLEDDLLRCVSPLASRTRGLWLLTHERLRHTPRVRVVLDFLGDRLARLAREGSARAAAAQAAGSASSAPLMSGQ